MKSNKLQMKDFNEFKVYFMKIKDEINEKFVNEPAGDYSEDVTIGF
jgi:hypothetical protein